MQMPHKTVSDVMQDVFAGSKFKCLPYEKRNLDEDPYSEYAEYDRRIKGKTFENPANSSIRTVPTTGVTEQVRTILRYFMDGSRRVFRFTDVILSDGRYYPVLAGQVGVAVLMRADDGSITPMRDYVRYENILVLPDTIDRADQDAVRGELSAKKLHFKVADYETAHSGGNNSEDYLNKGTKQILDLMHDIELDAVNRMMSNRDLRDDAMLVVDGSLQFRRDVLKRNNFPIGQLANAIGISKSFTPSQPVTGARGSKHLGDENVRHVSVAPIANSVFDKSRRESSSHKASIKQEMGHAFGISRGEQCAHRRALGKSEQCGPRRSNVAHDRIQIVHAFLQRRGAGDAIREPLPHACRT